MKNEIEVQGVIDVEIDVFNDSVLEIGDCGGQAVTSRRQSKKAVMARRISSDRTGIAGGGLNSSHGRVRNHGAGFVADITLNGSGHVCPQ